MPCVWLLPVPILPSVQCCTFIFSPESRASCAVCDCAFDSALEASLERVAGRCGAVTVIFLKQQEQTITRTLPQQLCSLLQSGLHCAARYGFPVEAGSAKPQPHFPRAFFFPSPAICLVHSVWRQVEYLPSSLKCGMGLLQFVLLQV